MKARTWLVVATIFVVLGTFSGSALAQHRGFGGSRGRVGVFFGFSPFYSPYYAWGPGYPYYWGWSPWYGYPGEVRVKQVDYGKVEFRVNPVDTQIYVDNKPLGMVRDMEGRHHTAKMPHGYHEIKLVAPDGHTVQRNIYVAAGETFKLDLDL